MHRIITLFAFIVFAVFAMSVPALAQEPPAATAEPVVTTAEPVVAAPPVSVTVVPGNAEQPAVVVVQPSNDTTKLPESWTTSLPLIERAGYIAVIIILVVALISALNKLYKTGIDLKDMVSLETVRSIYADANRIANAVTDAIPGKIDDVAKEALFSELKRWIEKEYVITTTTVSTPVASSSVTGGPG